METMVVKVLKAQGYGEEGKGLISTEVEIV